MPDIRDIVGTDWRTVTVGALIAKLRAYDPDALVLQYPAAAPPCPLHMHDLDDIFVLEEGEYAGGVVVFAHD